MDRCRDNLTDTKTVISLGGVKRCHDQTAGEWFRYFKRHYGQDPGATLLGLTEQQIRPFLWLAL